MSDFKELIIQPTTFFKLEGVFLVTLFPTLFKGFTSVLCGKEKGKDRVRVIHDCVICKGVGHKNCPYVREGIKYYMTYVQEKYPAYSIFQRKITINPRWYQFSTEETAELIKKVKVNAEPVTQYSRSG